jgi:hypothetical protein
MPRPTASERHYDETSCRHRSAWPAILLASPLGLLVAFIVVTEIRTSAPAVVHAGAAGIAAMPEPLARPQPVAGPAAIGGPALGAAPRDPTPHGRTVPAAQLKALLTDPAVRDFKGLSENSWDFTEPAGIPGFGAGPGAGQRPVPGEFKLSSDR